MQIQKRRDFGVPRFRENDRISKPSAFVLQWVTLLIRDLREIAKIRGLFIQHTLLITTEW